MANGKTKSVLILGAFNQGALEHQYVNGFLANNWEVNCLDIQAKVNQLKKNILHKVAFTISNDLYLNSVNKLVLQQAASQRPTVILVFKGMELWPSTIAQLKNYCELICNYNADHPFKFYSKGAGNKNVKDSIPLFDIHFSYAKSICEQLSKEYHKKCLCLPFGYDDSIKPSIINNPNITNNFVFVGAWDEERQHKLENLRQVSVHLYGPPKWREKIKQTDFLIYHPEQLFDLDYADACLNAAGIINFLRPQNIKEQSHNMRTFEVPGYGGVLVSERTEEQLMFFEEDKEAIYFSGLEELTSKLTFYQNRTDLLKKIKEQALHRAQKSEYSYQHRSNQMITYLSKELA